MAKPLGDVILNIPYDKGYERLFLAFIAGVNAFGFVPHATLEIPGSKRRLDRILDLIGKCNYSIHDLSRVQLDRRRPATPRFNMPFELGLAVAWDRVNRQDHTWFVFESLAHRASKSLSDLGGTEVYIHDGTVRGVFRELCSAFVRQEKQPTVAQMRQVYADLRQSLPDILRRAGARDPFQARVFREVCVVAAESARRTAPAKAPKR